MQLSSAVRPGVFEWVAHIAEKGANIVIAGEKGSGKTYLLNNLIKRTLNTADDDKVFLSLKRFPIINTSSNSTAIAMAPHRHNDAPLVALRKNQDRLFIDEVENGETLENIFLFHDFSNAEGKNGQFVFTLSTDTTIEDKILELAPQMSGEEVCSELLETIDFVIYTIPLSEYAGGYPHATIASIKEVIVDADGRVGERTIWQYDHLEEAVYLQMNSPSRRRREKFFWC